MEIYAIANRFFDRCLTFHVKPIQTINIFRERLEKVAQTLARSTKCDRALLDTPIAHYKKEPTCSTSSDERAVQVATNGDLAHTSSPVQLTVLDPSEITAKTTHEISQNIRNGAEKICIENDYQIVSISEVEVLQETQQEAKDQELKSQEQQNIFKEINIAVGAEYSFKKENTPNWVQEYEDKIRLGSTLPRSELLKLAEFRVGRLCQYLSGLCAGFGCKSQ